MLLMQRQMDDFSRIEAIGRNKEMNHLLANNHTDYVSNPRPPQHMIGSFNGVQESAQTFLSQRQRANAAKYTKKNLGPVEASEPVSL